MSAFGAYARTNKDGFIRIGAKVKHDDWFYSPYAQKECWVWLEVEHKDGILEVGMFPSEDYTMKPLIKDLTFLPHGAKQQYLRFDSKTSDAWAEVTMPMTTVGDTATMLNAEELC